MIPWDRVYETTTQYESHELQIIKAHVVPRTGAVHKMRCTVNHPDLFSKVLFLRVLREPGSLHPNSEKVETSPREGYGCDVQLCNEGLKYDRRKD